MTRFSVLLSTAALVVAIAAMSAGGSGVRDVVDPDLTAEVEALVEGSVLREFAGLATHADSARAGAGGDRQRNRHTWAAAAPSSMRRSSRSRW